MFTVKTKLISRIPQVEKNLRQRVEEAVGQAVQDAAVIARQLVPVKTGFLRDSITAYKNTRGNWVLGAAAPYAAFVEFGTSTQAAQPFLRPAGDAVKPVLLKKLTRMKVL